MKCFIFFITTCLLTFQLHGQESYPKREFRGVWIATLNAIDWPYDIHDTAEQQKEEFLRLLNYHKTRGINTVIVQVRSSADVIYPSNIEPWAKCISGEQGKAPSPFYDPLEFMIKETHKRGMEFHAWVNPFRAITNTEYVKVSSDHISKTHPEWVLKYHNLAILNPGIPEARDYILTVIEELISNYDIDALHFDDYFYPYPDHGEIRGDRATYRKYKVAGENIHDWRRSNINTFIEEVHELLLHKKPGLKFGISPYGVWRNDRMDMDGSPTKSGYTSYDHLFADVRLWLQNGWIDYVAPQVYQSTQHRKIPFKPLVNWWSQNTFGKHLYVGHATYRVQVSLERGWRDNNEVPTQMNFCRELDNVQGSIFYNSTSLLNNQGGIADSLMQVYQYPALPPLMPWVDATKPNAPSTPKITTSDDGILLEWETPQEAKDGDLPRYYAIYSTSNGKLPDIEDIRNMIALIPSTQTRFVDERTLSLEEFTYLITSIDQLQNESTPVLPSYPKDNNVILPSPYNEKMIVELQNSVLKSTWKIADRVVDNQEVTMIKDLD